MSQEITVATMILAKTTGTVYFDFPTDNRRYPVRFLRFFPNQPMEAIDLPTEIISNKLETLCIDYLNENCARVEDVLELNIKRRWNHYFNGWQCIYQVKGRILELAPAMEYQKFWWENHDS